VGTQGHLKPCGLKTREPGGLKRGSTWGGPAGAHLAAVHIEEQVGGRVHGGHADGDSADGDSADGDSAGADSAGAERVSGRGERVLGKLSAPRQPERFGREARVSDPVSPPVALSVWPRPPAA
jgi:hypothetical protein